jgi:hypothetical protein
MTRFFYLRIASALVACSVAFLLVSFDPYLSAAPIAPDASDNTPAVSVNRLRKGDRLPLYDSGTALRDFRGPEGLQSRKGVPFGCDRAFSPVSAPSLSAVYGRCMA